MKMFKCGLSLEPAAAHVGHLSAPDAEDGFRRDPRTRLIHDPAITYTLPARINACARCLLSASCFSTSKRSIRCNRLPFISVYCQLRNGDEITFPVPNVMIEDIDDTSPKTGRFSGILQAEISSFSMGCPCKGGHTSCRHQVHRMVFINDN